MNSMKKIICSLSAVAVGTALLTSCSNDVTAMDTSSLFTNSGGNGNLDTSGISNFIKTGNQDPTAINFTFSGSATENPDCMESINLIDELGSETNPLSTTVLSKTGYSLPSSKIIGALDSSSCDKGSVLDIYWTFNVKGKSYKGQYQNTFNPI